ncbi:MAG: metal-dependent transcriptional regulator [Clostridia bacterium]|nr:metal-dependent transcriptional regulator [Clostridia bacterium]
MTIYESGEDYLEQILVQQLEKGHARSIDIAIALGYSKPSVSIAMKSLREKGLITMDAANHISLTEEGQRIAERIYERHQKLTAYLVSLGVSAANAKEDACKMEHDISEETFRAMCAQLEK